MEPYERLRIIRNKLNMNQTDFGKSVNLAQSTMGQIESGTRRLTERVLEDICRVHNINKNWLLYGIEPMILNTPSTTMEQLKKEFSLDDFDYNLVYEYLKLSSNKRKVVREFFYNVVESGNVKDDFFDNVPKTPEELEKRFPPEETPEDKKNVG